MCFALELEARHIVGGEVIYECRGGGRYDFTMFIYRDCSDSEGACFDSDDTCLRGNSTVGTVTIFQGINIIEIVTLTQPSIRSIPATLSNPCLIVPPNVCVEEGIYNFSAILPNNGDNITISYQRCCRNNFITNIRDPESSGSTYTTTLFNNTLDSCNSSPKFNDFPPIIICRGEDVNFDHSATDPEGDSLVYSFYNPFLGGGPNGGANFQAPFGVAPNPEPPPPYENVRYIGSFRFDSPLNAVADRDFPSVTIDSETGLISGFPGNIGQYVVGVSVRAYRDGRLINEVLRDFQFNVADCENDLRVDIEETELRQRNGEDLFYVRICGDGVLIDESTNPTHIEEWLWEFEVDGRTISSTNSFPDDLLFPGEGPYDGTLTLNPDQPQCTATGLIQVEIFPNITADFDFDFDTCIAGPVTFTNQSVSDAGPNAIVELRWELDTITSLSEDLVHTFSNGGIFDVSLTARDSNECTEEITKEVPYLPVPPFLVIAPSAERACVPATIQFDNLTNPISEDYDILWDFGDGSFGDEVSPTHTYDESGVYPISLNVTSPFGCSIDTSFGNLIEIIPRPFADFVASPEEVSRLDPVVEFFDQSLDAIRWDWLFDEAGISIERNPIHTFTTSGPKVVRLIVTNSDMCQDTTFREVIVVPDIAYKLPNAFTPNADGVNDLFFGVGNVEDAKVFQLAIWNRYGELIFETEDGKEGWNGRKNNVGKDAPAGVYVVTVKYVNQNDEVTNLNGFVTLIR